MKNKLYKVLLVIVIMIIPLKVHAAEEDEFNGPEVEISPNVQEETEQTTIIPKACSLDDDSLNYLYSIISDGDDTNNYLDIEDGTKNYYISGEILNIAEYNEEPVTIKFQENSKISYVYDFSGWKSKNEYELPLGVNLKSENDQKIITFAAAQTIPCPVKVSINIGEANEKYYMYYGDKGEYELYDTVTSDEDGFITLVTKNLERYVLSKNNLIDNNSETASKQDSTTEMKSVVEKVPEVKYSWIEQLWQIICKFFKGIF